MNLALFDHPFTTQKDVRNDSLFLSDFLHELRIEKVISVHKMLLQTQRAQKVKKKWTKKSSGFWQKQSPFFLHPRGLAHWIFLTFWQMF